MATPPVVVVGSTNTDLIVRTPRLPTPGETVLGGDFATAAGGKGANQAVAAARLGARVALVARVGDDANGRQALAQMAREGLDTRFVVADPAAPSGVALIVVDRQGENLIAVAPGANYRLSPEDVKQAEPAFVRARVLLLQLESPLETVLAAARLGKAHGLTVVLNPAPAQSLPEELYALTDFLTPNQHEAAALTGQRDPQAAAGVLLRRGAKTVVVTLGEDGALAATSEGCERVAGFAVEAVDATAAGDAFNGALAVAVARGEPLRAAIRFAHAAAAVAVTRPGAQPSLPTSAEVQAFLANAPPLPVSYASD